MFYKNTFKTNPPNKKTLPNEQSNPSCKIKGGKSHNLQKTMLLSCKQTVEG